MTFILVYYVTLIVQVAVGLLMFGVQLWALADALRTPANDFQRAYKRTKGFWGGLTGVAAFFGLLYLIPALTLGQPSFGMSFIFDLAAVTIAGVYLADVRPALAPLRGRGNQNRGNSW